MAEPQLGLPLTGIFPIRPLQLQRHKEFALNRNCEACERPLFGKCKRDETRKRFCSATCRGRALPTMRGIAVRKLSDKTCARCNSQFTGSHMSKYCSTRCATNAACAAMRARRATVEGHLRTLCNRPDRRKLTVRCLLDLFNAQNGKCALTGLPMTWARGAGRVETNISIDRIKAGAPYTPDNVRLVCRRANLIRNRLSDEELLSWCKRIVEHANAIG